MRKPYLFLAVLLVLAPATAFAWGGAAGDQQYQQSSENPDNFLVPWFGVHFNNGLTENFGTLFTDEDNKPKAMGVTLGFWARNLLSAEIDFGYSKDYFGSPDLLGGNNLMTVTGSLLVGPWIPIGPSQRLRPYGVIGGGLARSKIEDFVVFGKNSRNRGVIDYGGGLFLYLTRNLGVRGDIRFMKDVGSDPADTDGWGVTDTMYKRATVGLVLAW